MSDKKTQLNQSGKKHLIDKKMRKYSKKTKTRIQDSEHLQEYIP
jgi:hypothetical protein